MTTSISIQPSGLNESSKHALASSVAGISWSNSTIKMARLVRSIRWAVLATSRRSSPERAPVIRPSKNIIQASVSVPRSKASKTKLRALRAAEMEYWNETGGDALRSTKGN